MKILMRTLECMIGVRCRITRLITISLIALTVLYPDFHINNEEVMTLEVFIVWCNTSLLSNSVADIASRNLITRYAILNLVIGLLGIVIIKSQLEYKMVDVGVLLVNLYLFTESFRILYIASMDKEEAKK